MASAQLWTHASQGQLRLHLHSMELHPPASKVGGSKPRATLHRFTTNHRQLVQPAKALLGAHPLLPALHLH